MVDPHERLTALLRQENETYCTSDYLDRMYRDASAQTGPQPPAPMHHVPDDVCRSPNKRCRSSSADDAGVEGTNRDASGPYLPIRACHTAQTAPGEGAGRQNPDDPRQGSVRSTLINRFWREKLCEWQYQVVDHFDLRRDIVAVAMNYFDRYLATCEPVYDKAAFQLLAMTCLNLAIKLYIFKYLMVEGSSSTMETILMLSKGNFTIKQMEAMESELLSRLKWHVHPPTPFDFIQHILFICSWDHEVRDLAQFMAELSVIDYNFVPYKSYEIAIAALLNALEELIRRNGPERLDFFLARLTIIQASFITDSPSILACRERLHVIYHQAVGLLPHEQADDPSAQHQQNEQQHGQHTQNHQQSPAHGTISLNTTASAARTVSPVDVVGRRHLLPLGSESTCNY